MSFQPVVPFAGYAGLRFLKRTLDTQKAAYAQSQPIRQAATHFRDKIGSVKSVDDLMGDRQLLSVALTAFGLEGDIANKAFIRKVLSEGYADDAALSNRLADKRYLTLTKAFGFGVAAPPRTGLTAFPDEILTRYRDRSFAGAVGEQDNTMRLALNVGGAVDEVLAGTAGNNARWFAMMGNAPLRSVFEGALGFSPAIGRIDVDRQLSQFKDRARATFGTDNFADLADPRVQEKIERLYMIRTEAAAGSLTSGGSIALQLLRSSTGR